MQRVTRRHMLRGALALLAAGAAAPLPLRSSQAQAAARITVIDPLVWLRNAPSLIAGNSAPVRKGEFYDVLTRSSDNRWLQLNVPGAGSRTWMPATHAVVTEGDLARVAMASPVSQPQTSTPAKSVRSKAAKTMPAPSWIPKISVEQRARYTAAARSGKDPAVFTVIGDCNSQPAVYLRRVSTGEFDASRIEPHLQAMVLRFAPSFGRISLAAKGGFGTGAMMDPLWADGALCGIDKGPFECEVWVSRASIVFIELGTGDQLTWRDFEGNYRPLIEHALAKGTLPVLVTKADDIETAGGASSGHINGVIRKLAAEYRVPLLDFFQATRDLPNVGLLDEGDKDFHLNDAGIQRHMEATLQTLAAIAG